VFIKELDNLDIELNEILGRLKGVGLDPGFEGVSGERVEPTRKSLHDFVDEQGIEDLKTQLRQAIDEVQVPSTTTTDLGIPRYSLFLPNNTLP
jgi:autophagy-related protein 17